MPTPTQFDRETLLTDVVDILNDLTSDWDTDFSGGISPDTRLIGDLLFESIDVVQFVVALEERFQRHDLPLEKLLMHNGRYVDELRVADIVDLLAQHLS